MEADLTEYISTVPMMIFTKYKQDEISTVLQSDKNKLLKIAVLQEVGMTGLL